jgi:hypothetical protein
LETIYDRFIYDDGWCVVSFGKDKFDRLLGEVYTPNLQCLQTILVRFYGVKIYC